MKRGIFLKWTTEGVLIEDRGKWTPEHGLEGTGPEFPDEEYRPMGDQCLARYCAFFYTQRLMENKYLEWVQDGGVGTYEEYITQHSPILIEQFDAVVSQEAQDRLNFTKKRILRGEGSSDSWWEISDTFKSTDVLEELKKAAFVRVREHNLSGKTEYRLTPKGIAWLGLEGWQHHWVGVR